MKNLVIISLFYTFLFDNLIASEPSDHKVEKTKSYHSSGDAGPCEDYYKSKSPTSNQDTPFPRLLNNENRNRLIMFNFPDESGESPRPYE